MPFEKEKEALALLIKEIQAIQENLQTKAVQEPQTLPIKLKEEINNLCEEVSKETRSEQARFGDSNAKDVLQALSALKENMNKTAFLVDSVNLALQAKANNSTFLAKLGGEATRFGSNFKAMLNDDSRTAGNKIWTCMKAVVSTCIDAAVGACKGIRQGFVEGKGIFNTLGGLAKGAVAGGLLGAASGAADALLNDRERATKQIADLKKSHGDELSVLYEKVKNEEGPGLAANKARIEVIKEESSYLSELDTKLKNNPDPQTAKETVGSLRILGLTSAGSALMHTGLEMVHDFGSKQKFGGLEGGKALAKLGQDVVSATKNFNAVLDDSSSSMPSKLFSITKAFAMAAWEGMKGCGFGAAEGFQEGKGFSKIGTAFKGALFGGFSGLARGFDDSLKKDLAAKQGSEVELGRLANTQTATQPKIVGSVPLSPPSSSVDTGRAPAKDVELDGGMELH